MGRLFLLTDQYPYGRGETFIAAELPYLVAHNMAVHLVPTARDALAHRDVARPVPPGVVVRSDLAQRFAEARAAGVVAASRSLAAAAWRKRASALALAHEMCTLCRLSPFGTAHNVKRLAQALAHAATFAEVLRTADDGPAPGDGVYAYWLGASALGAHWADARVPIVARAHGHDLFARRHEGNYLPAQGILVAHLRALYCISEDGGRHARKLFGEAQKNICVMPLGVAATPRRAEPSQDNTLRIVSCARAVPIKNLFLCVAALQHVTTPVEWTHVGDGPDRERLMRAAKKLPRHVRVRWPGAVAPEAVQGYLTDTPVDLFLNTSHHEGRPVSIMEALAVGLPVRAPHVGGIAEMLPDGWLFPPGIHPQALSRRLEAFAAMPESLKQAERQMALLLWQTHANAAYYYPAFARHLKEQLALF